MLKTIIMWLLLVAIPVQGLAANATVICKASHQRATQLSAVHHAQHGHHAAMHDHHDHHAYQHQAADAAAPSDEGGKVGDSQLSKCSACAASCAGALWATTGRMSLPEFAAASDCISYTAFHIPGVDPDPPEHPPRFSLG